jgi:16S rRNA (cytidine1402-2'-O)-methyltransferase
MTGEAQKSGTPGGGRTLPPLKSGALYLVATPIGNLEDITLRAVRVLRECSLVAAEDTRRTGQLLSHLGFHKPLVSLFKFNEARRSGQIVERLLAGDSVALVSDAGTPGISDPGARVVADALAAGVVVEPVPGPCALVAAIAASGLPTDEFHFGGFLPRKSGARARRLAELSAAGGTLVLYESPFRVAALMAEIAGRWPARRVVVARELTKKFEEWMRGDAKAVAATLAGRSPKGEFVVLLAPENEGAGVAEPPGESNQIDD